jgi:hypothetical protein
MIEVTPAMARVFIAALASAKADRIPKVFAAGQREERDTIIALRSVFALIEGMPTNESISGVLAVWDEVIADEIYSDHTVLRLKQARAAVAALIARNAKLEAERDASDKYTWADGFPTKHNAEEWFLADTEFGPAVLRNLPEEYAYDYTTADHTYVMKERVKRWMQLPDSEFIAYASRGEIFELRAERDAVAAENRALREAAIALVVDPEDPNIGWRGRASTDDVFSCEHCKSEHFDCVALIHDDSCPVPAMIEAARAALARTPAATGDGA